MKNGVQFSVFGVAVTQGSKRHVGRGRMVEMSKGLKPWRELIGIEWLKRGGVRCNGFVTVDVRFYLPSPKNPTTPFPKRKDIDKLCRAVLDALTQCGAIEDDSYVCNLYATKSWADPTIGPETTISIYEV